MNRIDWLATPGGGIFLWVNPQAWTAVELSRTLSFVLLHSLWQGAAIAALLWVALRCIPARRTNARYLLTTISLVGFILGSCVTGAILNLPAALTVSRSDMQQVASDHVPNSIVQPDSSHNHSVDQNNSTTLSATGITHLTGQPRTSSTQSGRASTWPRWVVWGWLLGMSVMLVRVGASLLETRRLVQNSIPVPMDVAEHFKAIVQELCQTLRIRRPVRLACTDWLNVPAVCGTIWPVLLMPTAMLTGIPLEQWRLILAHELAHIRRHDYFVNVVQMLIEAVYFFNPAVWWISRQMRLEREACCDALAVQVTGQPLAVARALVNVADWVRQGSGRSPKTLVAWQSVDGNAAPGELTDRVKRIARPEAAPRLRMPWYSLLGMFLASGVVFLGLQVGAEVAVKVVAQALSPRERVEKLVALDRQLSEEAAANGNMIDDDVQSDSAKPQLIKITGVISMADGSEVPKATSLNSIVLSKEFTSHSTLVNEVQSGITAPFSFNCKTSSVLYVTGHIEGYAPAIVGPIVIKPGQKQVDPLKVVFDKGVKVSIRLVDAKHQPIAGARVSASIWIKHFNSASGTRGWPETTSDENGLVRIEHAQSKYPYTAIFDAPGFQSIDRSFTFPTQQTVEWEIPKARVTTGQVVAAETGLPVSGAQILLVEAKTEPTAGSSRSWGQGDPRTSYAKNNILATTNAEGKFELNTLVDGVQYGLYIRTKEFRPAVLGDVGPGETCPTVRLLPPLVVKGQILGANKLPKQYGDTEDTRTLSFGTTLRVGELGTSYGSGIRFPVRIIDGVGHFELRELFPAEITFTFGSRQESLLVKKSITDFVVDLNQEPSPEKIVKKRRVAFALTELADPAAVSGKLQVTWQGNGVPYGQSLLPVVNGRAETEIPVGASVYVNSKYLIGCWFNSTPQIVVEDVEKPLLINLAAVPAGAIQGQVLNQDGTPCDGFDVSVVIARKSPSMGQTSLIDVQNRLEVPGKFLFQQLPLGGEYRILIRSRDPASLAMLVSDPIALDESQPIQSVDLRFVEGAKLAIQVVDEQGSPVPNLGLRIEYSITGERTSHGFSKSFVTNPSGQAILEHVNWKTGTGHRVVIEPTKTRQGESVPMAAGEKNLTIELKRGLVGSGVLLDAATGQPLTKAKFRLAPKNYQQSGFSGWINATTNDKGEFRAENLSPRDYTLYIDGGDPVGRIYIPQANGGYSVTGEGEFPTITPGSGTPVEIKVQLRPDSNLVQQMP